MLNTQSLIDLELSENGFVGLFLRHKQNVKWYDKKQKREINYELNPKIFAINEPYLMKTERDSLMKLKLEEQDSETDNKKKTNASKKRKKNLDKKLALLDGNFDSVEEKSMALRLIEKYLNDNFVNETISKSPTKKTLLNSIKSQENDSNPEAQSFVNSLFCNRFESLNYRTKLLCNPFCTSIKAKFGLSNFLIPPQCSFAGIDVIEGVKTLTRYLKLASIESKDGSSSSTQSLICSKNPFVLIMDPAWDNNKSVKRKRTYETVSLDYMRRLCKETKILLDLISSLQAKKVSKNSNPNLSSSIVSAIWTTNLDKDFVIDEMLPLLNMKLSYVLKWHKVTKIGLPVKVHAGQEYLILAEKCNHNDNNKKNNDDVKNGIIVSVPSAIHSHKPNVMPVMHKLFHFNEDHANGNNDNNNQQKSMDILSTILHCSMPDPNSPPNAAIQEQNKHDINNDDSNFWLAANEFLNCLCGIELFARNLQTGFHSIGYECIKLQNEKLFNSSVDE